FRRGTSPATAAFRAPVDGSPRTPRGPAKAGPRSCLDQNGLVAALLAVAVVLALVLVVRLAVMVTMVAGPWEPEEQQLPTLADKGQRAMHFLLDGERVRLDVDEERALAEELRRVDDAARLPGPPQALRRARVHVGWALVGGLIHTSDDVRIADALQVVRPDARRCARADRVLVLRTRVLLEEQEILRRLDVVGLGDPATGPRAGRAAHVAVDQDREALDLRRILGVEHHLEEAAVRPRAHRPRRAAGEPR